MSSLTAELHNDVRLIERNLAKGFVSRAEVAKRNRDLADAAEKGEWVDIESSDDSNDED